MSKRTIKILTFLLIGALAVSVAGCKLLHEKVIDLVIRNSACMGFEERHDTAQYVGDRQAFLIAFEVDKALSSLDPPLERADIDTARLTSASYEVTWLEDPGHDWTIGGSLWIAYGGVEHPIATYDDVSLKETYELGEPVFLATLHQSGVDLFNLALDDYRAGVNPEVEFWVEGDSCDPRPQDVGHSLNYDWTGCINMYIVSPYRTEVVDFFDSE
jgi:hypothetical protein